MPTITPQARAQVNADPENFQQPRRTITQATGMNSPRIDRSQPTAAAPKLPQTGQGTTPEAPGSAVTLSPQLTQLARRQQKLQQEVQSQRDKEAAWEKEKAGYVPKDSLKAKAQQNAVEALQESLGMSYEELTNLMITQQNGADPVRALEAKISKLETDQVENTNRQYEATIKQYKAEASTLVSKDTKKYFLIDKQGAQDAVVQHIVDTWEENPEKVLTVEDAANDIEEFLREEAKKQKAYLDELDGPKEVPQAGLKKLPPPQKQAPRTLSQSQESSGQSRTYPQFQHLSMKERIAAAMAKAQR
jgi:hypothetical protein